MFRDTRKKKLRNRVILAALGVFIMTLGIWLNYQPDTDKQPVEDTVQNVEAEEQTDASHEVTSENRSDKREKSDEETGTDTEIQPETYLIKEVDGVVKVFLCDGDGNKELYLITSIPFDLLSESDQQLFVDGVEIKTEDDLGEFLQNFDS